MGALCCCTLAKGMLNAYDAVIPQVLCVVFYNELFTAAKTAADGFFSKYDRSCEKLFTQGQNHELIHPHLLLLNLIHEKASHR